jgi:uncharacterized protein (DUF3084 family)
MIAEQLQLIRAEYATLEKELRRVVKSNRRLRDRVDKLTKSRNMWRARAAAMGWSTRAEQKRLTRKGTE